MKVEIQSKKGLRTVLSVIVDKSTIQNKLDERLNELQKEVSLKGFRTGKVPTSVIKSQFGKSIYGEVIDKILRETSAKAIKEKTIADSKNQAAEEAEKIIISAKEQINNEKKKAMTELKNQVADIAIDMAETILKAELKDSEKQKTIISEALKKQMN